MPPQRKRKAAELNATDEPNSEAAPITAQAPSGLRRSARRVPVKSAPVVTMPAPKRRDRKGKSRAASITSEHKAVAGVPTPVVSNLPASADAQTITQHIQRSEDINREHCDSIRAFNDEPEETIVPSPRSKGKRKGKVSEGEEVENFRAARWRPHPPQAVQERIVRCMSQRMYVLGREPVEGADPPEEKFQMAGTTGNVYTVHINNRPSCTCPDGRKRGTCKHILYIMIKALRAREDLVYQAALTNAELRMIFANGPAPASIDPPKSTQKPLEEDDCPICYSELEATQSIVFCRAMCGVNIHKDCFQQWAETKGNDNVTCVMCRTKWEYGAPEDGAVDIGRAEVGHEGYINVASQLGLSKRRNYNPNSWKGAWRENWLNRSCNR